MRKKILILSLSLIILCTVAVVGYYAWYFPNDGAHLGEDRNHNKIWDDVELKIDQTYGANKNVTQAAKFLAIAIQDSIINLDNSLEQAKIVDEQANCLFAAAEFDKMDEKVAMSLWVSIDKLIMTTRARQVRYIKFNANLSGHTFPMSKADKTKCKFNFESSSKRAEAGKASVEQ